LQKDLNSAKEELSNSDATILQKQLDNLTSNPILKELSESELFDEHVAVSENTKDNIEKVLKFHFFNNLHEIKKLEINTGNAFVSSKKDEITELNSLNNEIRELENKLYDENCQSESVVKNNIEENQKKFDKKIKKLRKKYGLIEQKECCGNTIESFSTENNPRKYELKPEKDIEKCKKPTDAYKRFFEIVY